MLFPFLLALIVPNPALDLSPILFLHLELLLQLRLMLIDLTLTIIIDLIEQVHSGFFPLLPLLLLLLLDLDSLSLDELVQLFLIHYHIVVFVLYSGEGSLSLISLLLLHQLLVFSELPLFVHDSLDHLPIPLSFQSCLLLFV